MSHVPYVREVGNLMSVIVFTKIYNAHAVGAMNNFMSRKRKEHWTTLKQAFMYFHVTSDYGLCYQGRLGLYKILDICGFVYAEWARDLDQIISISGYVFNLFE